MLHSKEYRSRFTFQILKLSPLPIFIIVTILSSFILANDKPCVQCTNSTQDKFSASTPADPCDDLFSASCKRGNETPNGGNLQTHSADLNKPIYEARLNTVRKMGFRSIEEAVFARLSEEGILMYEPAALALLKYQVGTPNTSPTQIEASQLYPILGQCNHEIGELENIQLDDLKDLGSLKDVSKRIDAFGSKYQDEAIVFYAKDIPAFFSDQIGSKCNQIQRDPNIWKPADNPEIMKICERLASVKDEAVEVFRAEGTPDHKKLAEQFIRKYQTPEVKQVFTDIYQASNPPPANSELEKIRRDVRQRISEGRNYCSSLRVSMENATIRVFSDFMASIGKDKTTVETLIDSVYSLGREKQIKEIFNNIRSDIQALVRAIVKDPKKRQRIIDEYENIKLFWIKKPVDELYVKNSNGSLILSDTIDPLDTDKAVVSIFFDPDLSHFKSNNAYYTPTSSNGVVKVDEQIAINPGLLHLLEKSPIALIFPIAHEMAHKIDPKRGALNGHDLSAEYEELLTCYKNNSSIKLEKGQSQEVIADYIASEILARQVQNLPKSESRERVMEAMSGLCIIEEDSRHYLSLKGPHPSLLLRFRGIFSANPSLRKVMDCPPASTKYKTCGLRVSILDLPNTNQSDPNPKLDQQRGAK